MGYVTVSAKIRRELWEKLRRYNISISDVIRRALEEEVRKAEEEELVKLLDEVGQILSKVPDEEIVRAVRMSRDER
ncbi:type II toxin-antitoxin system CcdA family antitoxin [Vulcanisaeta sp. JCM 16159]|uniref:type II toxin-antitoxin system CcdA family antitoxin n=1 Tax=Vulcanisaeta sp. JCM 16159 TaxID=1295371 RepID=UPI0006CF765B|nr:type II toxin-antitoxin system CcdA family antitoxin [Vulcanisaeta sp. JCM 16159]